MVQFPRIVPALGDKKLSFHPGVMMIRKESYWLAGGCDEDFVGQYGQTDPHFRWRASNTGYPTKLLHIKSLSRNTSWLPMNIEPMENDHADYSCKVPLKNDTRNKMLILSKKSKKVAWSKEFLRFKWSIVDAPDASQLQKRLDRRSA